MYIPGHFAAPGQEALYEIMQCYPLATLVTQTTHGLEANHLPLRFALQNGAPGILSGHIARANPLWQQLENNSEVLVIFHGPNTYVSPSWYPAKITNGMVVPTWNYVVVHVRGKFKVMDDQEWLVRHIESLTSQHEAAFEKPWQVQDAPSGFIAKMINAIVGIEIEMTAVTGKWKASQNQAVENRQGVIQALRESGTAENHAMAAIMERLNGLR